MKATKEFYERRQEEKIEGQDIFYILPLFLGSVGEEILLFLPHVILLV